MRTIVAWLQARHPEIELADDFDLIENRVIDSLHFMEFLFLLQEVTGRDISLDGISLDHFRTLRAIRANFFDASGADVDETEEAVF
jgi:acyl carrier protein